MKKAEDERPPFNPSNDYLSLENDGDEGLWEWDLETSQIFFSTAWEKMLGYQGLQIDTAPSSWNEKINRDDYQKITRKLKEYISGSDDSLETRVRLRHKEGYEVLTLFRAFRINRGPNGQALRLSGSFTNISNRRKTDRFIENNAKILEMIAIGIEAAEIYSAIALMYEERNPGIRCSMLELDGDTLLHGGAPSLPKAYTDAVYGLKIGPNVGSCSTSAFTGERCLVENIETDPKWAQIKHLALPHGMRCCWSEPVKNSSGKVLGAFGMYLDYPALPTKSELADLISAARLSSIVMERDQAQKFIHRLAYTDTLTELSSRSHFYTELEKLISSAKNFLLLYLDLDDFKGINDNLGHDVGDQLLKEIARRLMSVSEKKDIVARIGGDEFCIIADNPKNNIDPNLLAQKYLNVISQPFELAAHKLSPSCSIGVANFPEDGGNSSFLVKAADTALFAAKAQGKNQHAIYRPEFTEKVNRRFKVDLALREAIENNLLRLEYQPQVNVHTREIIGVEALCRWSHPELGEVEPTEFIATAERLGMMKPLTEWVLATASKEAAAWRELSTTNILMAVNISSESFLDGDIVSLIKGIISETGISPERLELEITESTVQTAPANTLIFEQLKRLGVRLAIDDFGTGYSSIASLKHLQVDRLKIDRYFLTDFLSNDKAKRLVNFIINMGRNLGHEIIAEGVETEAQLALLKEMGCGFAQGYLFGKAMPAKEITALLQARRG